MTEKIATTTVTGAAIGAGIGFMSGWYAIGIPSPSMLANELLVCIYVYIFIYAYMYRRITLSIDHSNENSNGNIYI